MTRDEIIQAAQPVGGMFAVIPSVVMKDKALSMSARMLYGIITWRCNENAYCWATNRTLAEDMGLSHKRISSLLSDLETQGHIEMEIVRDESTGQILRRYIYPVVKSSRGVLPPIPENEDTPIPKSEDTPPQSRGDPIPENGEEKYKKETKKEIIPPKAPQGGRRSKYELAEDAKPLLRAYCSGDRELAVKLAKFIDMRTQLRAINSKNGIAALLRKLDKLSQGDRAVKLELIDEAMANSWKSVFPLRGGGKGAASSPPGIISREEVPTW